MKKIFYILSLAAAASIALVSCVKEVAPHEPGPADAAGCYGVYFPTQDASGDHVYSPVEEKVLNVTVARTNTQGAITVPVKMTFSEDGIFEVAPVTFADGQEETSFAVRFDKAKEGVNYTGQFVIEDNQYASLYNSGAIGLDFSVLCVEMKQFLNPKTNEPAVFTFTHNWSGSRGEGHATMQYYEVDGIRTCIFTSIDKDANGAPVGLWHGDPIANLTLRWYVGDQPSVKNPGTKASHKNNQGNDFVEIVTQYIGFDYNDGSWIAAPTAKDAINAYDYFWFWNARGYSIEELNGSWLDDANIEGSPDQSYPLGYYDGNGGFYLYIYYYLPTLGGGWKPSAYNNVLIADGFTRVDYSFELATDFSDGGKAPIYIEAGADIKNIKYAVYPGELTETQVGNKIDAIAAGTEAVSEFSAFEFDAKEGKNYATLEVSPEATGKYTFVAVAYDESKQAQNSGSVVFNFIAASDEAEYAVDVDVFTEDTPARYKNFHDYDSFAYCVSGTDLVDVHVAIYTEATVAKYGAEVIFADAKADEDGDYALTEEQLAEVNADGGYYTIESELKPNTTYYVVVWATNGNLEQFAVDAYTTAKLPYVWNSIGKGQYTDDVACGQYSVPPITVPCEVEVEANNPGLYRISGFQLPLVAAAFGETEATMAAYEGKYWRNSPIIIDASNPESVIIELQDYGVCFNSEDGFIDGITSLYKGEPFSVGTLKDGVIAFPTVKGLLCTINGDGYYYANQNGAFKLVLPAAAPSSVPAYEGVAVNSSTRARKDFFAPSKVKYERDAKAVSVDVKVSYDRKAIDSASTVAAKPAKSVK